MPKNQEIEEKDDKIIEEEKISKEVTTAEKKVTGKSKEETKKSSKIENADKIEETAKIKTEKTEKVTSKNQVDEATVIEKIKSFIAKIAAMQEEAKKETQESKEVEESKEEKAKTKQAKKLEKEEKEEPKKFEHLLEYYDLPYRYNETVVKILAQTPKRMFVYWDISDNDRQKYVDTFGENFFEKTYPVLLVYNEDKKYVKEIPINDFANSWYVEIDDPKTKYTIQLGRKFKFYNEAISVNMQKVQENNIILNVDYLPFANSNILEVPNDHVLFETLPRFITFRNVKTNQETTRDLRSFKDVFGKIFNVKDFYEKHYKDELSEGMFDMANPSSNTSSPTFK